MWRTVIATMKTSTRRRFLLPAAVIVLWLAIAAVAAPWAGKLSEQQTNDMVASLPPASQSAVVSEQLAALRPSDGTIPAVVLYTADGAVLDAGQRTRVDAAVAAIADKHTPAIFSADGQAALTVVSLPADTLADAVGMLRDQVRDPGGGLSVAVAGAGGFLADLVGALGSIDGVLLAVSLVVVAIILLIVYRSVLLPAVVLDTSMLGLAVASGAVYAASATGAITLSGQAQGIMTILVIGASTDYALLYVAAYKAQLHLVDSPAAAAARAWRSTIGAITASAATVAAAVMCLTLSGLPAVAGLGPVAALGVVAAWAAAITFLPAVLTVAGRKAFWPRIPAVDSAVPDGGRLWARVSALVAAHPRALVTGLCILLLAAAAPVLSFAPKGATSNDVFMTTPESVAGNAELARHFPATVGSETLVVADTTDVDATLTALSTIPHMSGARPYTSGGAVVSVDGRSLVSVDLTVPGDSDAAYAAIDAARAAVPASASVGGPTAERHDTNLAAEADLKVLVPAVLAVIVAVLILLLRSLLAPALLVATVVLSFAATLGIGVLVFDWVGFAGIDASVPLFAFVFLVALGVDYSIFLMAAARAESATAGTRAGTLAALRSTGGVITSAGVVLAATFATLAVLPISFLFQLAFLVCFGVLLDTLVVRTLLVPSAVLLLGRYTWWPRHLPADGPDPAAPPM